MSEAVAGAPPVERELTRGQLIWTGLVLWLAFVVVAGSAAFSSFRHIVHVSLLAHQDVWVSYAMPLSIDGSMVISTIAMYRDRVTGRHARPWAKFTLGFGLAVSMYANASSYVADWGWHWGWIFWASLPPLLLMFSIEVMAKPGRIRQIAAFAVSSVERARAAVGELAGPAANTVDPGGDRRQHDVDAMPAPAPVLDAPVTGVLGASDEQAVGGVESVRGVRRGRPEDSEPLDPQLVDLALGVGRLWRERTGREITRDGLRAGLRDAGWQRGISNVTAGRLLDLIRNDGEADTDERADRMAAAASNGR